MNPKHTSSGIEPTVPDLDEDLQRLLEVDPSPEFVARVRTQITTMPAPSLGWPVRGLLVLASAAALVVVAVLLRPNDERSSISAQDVHDATTRPAVSGQSVPPAVGPGSSEPPAVEHRVSTAPARTSLALSVPRGRRVDAEVVVSPAEMNGLRRLFDLASQGDSGLESLLVEPAGPAPVTEVTTADIVIPPIAIDPLVSDTY